MCHFYLTFSIRKEWQKNGEGRRGKRISLDICKNVFIYHVNLTGTKLVKHWIFLKKIHLLWKLKSI